MCIVQDHGVKKQQGENLNTVSNLTYHLYIKHKHFDYYVIQFHFNSASQSCFFNTFEKYISSFLNNFLIYLIET